MINNLQGAKKNLYTQKKVYQKIWIALIANV